MSRWRSVPAFLAAAAALAVCDDSSIDDGGVDADADVDVDADADLDVDADVDADADGDSDSDADLFPVLTRDELREISLFENTSFEEAAENGRSPAAWTCTCEGGGGCALAADEPAHGETVTVLSPGCSLSQATEDFDRARAIRFDLYARGADPEPASFYIRGTDEHGGARMLYGDALEPNALEGAWDYVVSKAISSEGLSRIRMFLYNDSRYDLEVDDLIVSQDMANPRAALIDIEHVTQFAYRSGAEAGVVFVPLPTTFGGQVPLYVETTVTPDTMVQSLTYEAEAADNFGARIVFDESGNADPVIITWRAVVLLRSVDETERPNLFGGTQSGTEWLTATAVVNFTDGSVGATAGGLVDGGATDEEKMLSALAWTRAEISEEGFVASEDAATVVASGASHGAGYANVAAAFARALSLPARTLAVYEVGAIGGSSYLTAFHQGPARGWVAGNPRAAPPVAPFDLAVVVRNVLVTDEEGRAADQFGRWANAGVPLRTAPEPEAGISRLILDETPAYFPSCEECTVQARVQALLFDNPAGSIRTLFYRARESWQVDQEAMIAGAPSASRLATRREMLHAETVDDVADLLETL